MKLSLLLLVLLVPALCKAEIVCHCLVAIKFGNECRLKREIFVSNTKEKIAATCAECHECTNLSREDDRAISKGGGAINMRCR